MNVFTTETLSHSLWKLTMLMSDRFIRRDQTQDQEFHHKNQLAFSQEQAFACNRGATAIEFAIVALPFLFLLFAIVELSLILIMNNSLSNAMEVAAQQIRVGSVIATSVSSSTSSGSQLDLADFKQLVCSKIALVATSDCVSQLQVDVRTLSGYQNLSPPSPFSGKNFNTSALCFYSGQAGSVVEVTGYYLWPVLPMPFLNGLAKTTNVTTSSGSTSGTWFPLTFSEVFKTEPNAGIVNSGSGC